MKIRLPCLIACGLIACIGPTFARDPVHGPLRGLNVYFPFLFFVQSSGAYAGPQPAGTIATTITESYGNAYSIRTIRTNGGSSPLLVVDSEAAYTQLTLRWTPVTGTTIGARALHMAHYGGFLDPIIHTFHGVFGFPNGGRERRPQGKVAFFARPEPTDTFRWSSPLAGMHSFTVDVTQTLVPYARGMVPALSGDVSVKLPLVYSGFRASGVDAQARLLARWYAGSEDEVAVDASVGVAYLARPGVVPARWFNPWVVPAGISIAWRALPRFTPTISALGMTSPYSFDTITPLLNGFSAHVVFGASFDIGEHLLLQAGFAEEFFTFATADISFHASVQYRM